MHAFNQRDIAGILAMIRTLGALVGARDKADALARSLEAAAATRRAQRAARCRASPRVYFEEWDEPMISGIRWVSELIEIAGGIEVFPRTRRRKNAKDRIVSPHDGDRGGARHHHRLLVRQEIRAGEGRGARRASTTIPAVRNGWLREIKSPLILQPGPAALTDGLDALAAIIARMGSEPRATLRRQLAPSTSRQIVERRDQAGPPHRCSASAARCAAPADRARATPDA